MDGQGQDSGTTHTSKNMQDEDVDRPRKQRKGKDEQAKRQQPGA